MDIALVILFLFLGIAFLLLEIFFLPGISVGGVAGTAFVVAGIWYAFARLGTTAGWLALVIGTAAFGVAVWLFLKGRVLERLSLTAELKSDDAAPAAFSVGDTGRTLSRLAPVGRALIGGTDVEVKAREQLVDAGADIVIVGFDGHTPVVRVADKSEIR
ncbi:MAG: NfeD family protein [Candidatus Aphodosoma sp.]